MKRSVHIVFLILCTCIFFSSVNAKNLLIHTVEYKLNSQKLFTMATVTLHNQMMPAFIMLEPDVQVEAGSRQIYDKRFMSSQNMAKQKKELEKQKRKEVMSNFHKKLSVPIKLMIHYHDKTQQQCLFDQPWDMCIITHPRKSIDFSIHCLLQHTSDNELTCSGKAMLRQADLTRIQLSPNMYQQKTKYESGLFSLPLLDRHSVMLISCQDDELPMFSQSLKIFSTLNYHRYQSENSQEVKQFVGFDKSVIDIKEQLNGKETKLSASSKTPQIINSNKPQFIDKTKSQLLPSDKNFVYLDIEQQLLRKCLQFQFYPANDIVNDGQVFDYLNMTDKGYKNKYKIVRQFEKVEKQLAVEGGQKNGQKKHLSKDQGQGTAVIQQLFKYNLQLTLNVFKPQHFAPNQAYDIHINLIDTTKKSTIISYVIPFAITNESSSHTTSLYSRSNHYHFTYVVGNLLVSSIQEMQVEIEFEGRLVEKNDKKKDKRKEKAQNSNQFFFISLSVEDVQHVVVQKLQHSYISIKKGQHITFLLQQPYDISQKAPQSSPSTTDLVQVIPSSQHLKIILSQHLTDHQHSNQCHFTKGCKFQLDAVEDCLQCRIQYKTNKRPEDMLMLEIKSEVFEGKIDLDQTQYFYKELKPNQVIEFIINTPNIIVFTLQNNQDISKCQQPKKSCHSQIGTSHQKLILSNSNNQNPQMIYFAIQGLDKTRFSILLLTSDKRINVQNGVPFTYKLPQTRGQIELMFQIPQFEHGKPYQNNITFNLVAPLNSIQMDIVQLNDDGTQLQALQKTKTMSGFVKLTSKQIKSKHIKITLKKTLSYTQHSVHFTFIPSTSDHKFRLDTGITHYEVFDASEQKNFVIEFQDYHTYQIAMHFYDSEDDQINFSLYISNPSETSSTRNLNYKINSKDFTLILDQELIDNSDLCPENDPECTLFIMISSMMPHQVQLSITLLTADSVMELKDGVWETFNVDQLLINTHFYFTPTHENNPVKIFFKSTDPQIYLSALMYDNRQNVNPAEWPFPQTHGHKDEKDFEVNDNFLFKSNHLIQVDNEDPEFKKCFPHCVLLLSILKGGEKEKQIPKQNQQPQKQSLSKQTFSILASNSQIQLPQKMRLHLQLKQSQQQFIFVDLRHAFKQKKQMLTFFTNTMVGYASIYAKIYIPSLQNIPDREDYDILFEPLKTQVKLLDVSEYFMQNEAWMEGVQSIEEVLEREELYLALLIVAEEDTQLSLEYTTDYDEITQLEMDSVETVYLQQNQQKLFQFIPTRDQKIRFIRSKGYPLFHQFKCQGQKDDYNNCLKLWLQKLKLRTQSDIRTLKKEIAMQNDLSDSPLLTDEKMKEMAQLSQQQHFSQYQVLKKTQTQHVIQCQRCIVFIWIYALQPSQLTIQLQSLNTETLLKENQLLTDYLQPNEYHRYYLPRVQKELSTIVVSVNEGNPIVTVNDNFNFHQVKKTSEIKGKDRKVLVFDVPALKKPSQKAIQKHGGKIASFNNIFSNLHISLTPEDSKPVSYSITYSSGSHEMELKTGVISSQYLFQNQKAVFYYKNQDKNSKSYLTITVQALPQEIENILEGIEIQMYALTFTKETHQSSRNQLMSERPSMASKTLKKQTTLTYEIPPIDDLQINLLSKTTTKITIGINNGKIIFLPLNYQYPVFLKPSQQLKFVIQNLQQGHIQLTVKKCDQSNPQIFYTNDQEEFQKNLFSNYDRFGSSNMFKHVTRTKQRGILYIKVKADSKESSLLLISASYAMDPSMGFVDLDPGNMGVISYQFQSLNEVKLNFTGLQCGSQCHQSVDYYLIRSKSLPLIYNQLVCAGEQMIHLFQKQTLSKHQQSQQNPKSLLDPIASQIQVIKIQSQLSKDENHFQFVVPANEEYPFVTVKAVYTPTGEEVYYKPVEIKSFKGSVSNYSSELLLTFVGIVLLALGVLVWITQRLSRKGYVHVGQDQTMIV